MGRSASRSDHRNVHPFFDRYQNGDRVQVWNELNALGRSVRDPAIVNDARAVARETMRRAADNVDTLIRRLQHLGFEFHGSGVASRFDAADSENPGLVNLISIINRLSGSSPLPAVTAPVAVASDHPDVWSRPASDISTRLDRLERSVAGPLPLSMRAWCEEVGAVSLLGFHPALCDTAAPGRSSPELSRRAGSAAARSQSAVACAVDAAMLATDPLVVSPCFDGWDQPGWAKGPSFALSLGSAEARDTCLMTIPNAAADGLFLDGRRRYFVDYLRTAFRHGGFMGFAARRDVRPKEIDYLSEGLLEI